jgi:LPS export ABC transporter protein LptC
MRKQLLVKYSIALAVVLLITASLIWIYSLTDLSTTKFSNKTVDSFLLNTNVEQFSAKGILTKKIKATYLEHYPKLDMSYFVKPNITLYTINSKPWLITSDDGRSYHNNQIIELIGHARAHQDANKTTPAVTLKAYRLYYNVSKKLISTTDPVTIIRNKMITHANGLEFNTDTSRLILKSNMVTHYKPAKASAPYK